MRATEGGFKALELVVVVAIISLIVVVALPRFVRARHEDRESEVRANIHRIQIALERYAVDNGGLYPHFLVGAEYDDNILRCSIDLAGNGVSRFPIDGMTPFALTGDPSIEVERGSGLRIDVDPLVLWGYMSSYPVNPFAPYDGGTWNSSARADGSWTGIFPYGGLRGNIMFDLGFGWGDTPQTDFMMTAEEADWERQAGQHDETIVSYPDLDAPGNFYYHPVFDDTISTYIHYASVFAEVHNLPTSGGIDSSSPINHNVTGYLLYGYGAPGEYNSSLTNNTDYFNSMPERRYVAREAELPAAFLDGIVLDSSVFAIEEQQRVESTGYPETECDPWTGGFAINMSYRPAVSHESGPDGIPDWVLIEVASGLEIRQQH